jgi:octaheme c-type cytochrome (tetrathionate reductase family)
MIKRMKSIILFIILTILGFQITGQDQNSHSEMKGPFHTPQEVTKKCLECHNEVGDEILKTQHWTWLGEEKIKRGNKEYRIGKRNLINSFCVSVASNWPRCTSCHIGYGWKDGTFDFTIKENIDCLVCHDQTGTYKKYPTLAGYPLYNKVESKTIKPEKLVFNTGFVKIAQNVGKPTRQNCGVCHFYGGGGDGVKHGDLDSSLIKPSPELDFHMGELDFSCTECHKSEKHKISGALHSSMATNSNHFGCTDCHDDEKLHKIKKIDDHTDSVACQTCHIPEFARMLPTKTWWDWSTAGKDKGVKLDEFGKPLYDKKKGDFKWEKNVIPKYNWFNGRASYYFIGDKITDLNQILSLNKLEGSIKDSKAKIMPFKVMRGRQMVDTKKMVLAIPHLFGKSGFWESWDWTSAIISGMKSVGLDFSGSMGWVETKMYWPINHMVAPKKYALKCGNCHGSKGRMDWQALGYSQGDPRKHGGRFNTL